MSEQVVAKFGGTSMARPEVVAGIVDSRPDQQVVVVSAPGVDDAHPEKMTDTLIRYAAMARVEDSHGTALRDEIVERFDSLYAYCLDDHTRAYLRGQTSGLLDPSNQDAPSPSENYFPSLGEELSAIYFAELIGARAVKPAVRFSRTSNKVAPDRTKREIAKQIIENGNRAIVVPGFYGLDWHQNIRLLGRGGSDRTGAIYATSLGWDYENWTDVDGIMSAPPNVVSKAQTVSELTRREVREGANAGSGVLHGNALLDLDGTDVVTTVRNTFNPDGPATRIVADATKFKERDPANNAPVAAISFRDDLTVINIDDMGMADRVGYTAPIFDKMAKLKLSFANFPSAEDFASLTLHRSDQNAASISHLANFIRGRLISKTGGITVEDMSVVTLIGEALRDRRVAAKVVARTIGNASMRGVTITPLASLESPSTSFMVTSPAAGSARGAVASLVGLIHQLEIENPQIGIR